MFCVLCAVVLQNANQEGVLCHICKQSQRKNRTLIIQVQYCYTCGMPYCPSDTSIMHTHCFARGMNKVIISSMLNVL
jgi:predicted Zn-ribbon and HTH transcriptional regulator